MIMNLFTENQSSDCGLDDIIQDYSGLFSDEFSGDMGTEFLISNESMSAAAAVIPGSMVVETEKVELVNKGSCGRVVGKKSDSKTETKSVAALKSHSEAERRRRERINAHLAALRELLPSTDKMDKATLLAEVIKQVKKLKKTATQLSDNYFVPMDFDEVRVERNNNGSEINGNGDGTTYYYNYSLFRALICCEYRPGLFSEIRQALDTLNVNLVRSEISTLEGRVKNVFFFTGKNGSEEEEEEEEEGGGGGGGGGLMNSVHQALRKIMDNAAVAEEYSPVMNFPSKRRKISYLDSSSSSS